MDTQPEIIVEGNCIIGKYEPGNGTRYTAIGVLVITVGILLLFALLIEWVVR